MRRFILSHGKRHPAEMGPSEVVEFLTDLAGRQEGSASTHNQALSGLLFLYAEVVGKPLGIWDGMPLLPVTFRTG